MRAIFGTVIGTVTGAGAGAILGLVVVTLLNENCRTVAERLSGCRRYSVASGLGLGLVLGVAAGLLLGVLLGAVWEVRRSRRDVSRLA